MDLKMPHLDMYMSYRSRAISAAVSLGVVAFVAAGCSASNSGDGGSPSDAKTTLTIARSYDIKNLDPALMPTAGDQELADDLYSGLFKYTPGSTSLANDLVTSYSISPNKLEWTIEIRHNAKFPGGFGPLTASDVAYSLNRLKDPELASTNASQVSTVKDVVADGQYGVKIDLIEPDPTLKQKLARYYTKIVSKRAVEKYGSTFGQHPVGTGPFEFVSWTPSQQLVLKRFDGYFGKAAGVDNVIIKPITDVNTVFAALQAGQVDMVRVTDADHYRQYKSNPNFQIVSATLLSTRMITLNAQVPPFNNATVREALNYAINKTQMLSTVLAGLSTPADNVVPTGATGRLPGMVKYSYDPARSKQLLAQAGYPHGVSATLTVPSDPRFTIPATVIEQNAKAAGFNLKLNTQEVQSVVTALSSKNAPQMTILSQTFTPDPVQTLNNMFNSTDIPITNWGRVDSPAIDSLLAKLNTEDGSARAATLGQLQRDVAAGNYNYYLDYEKYIWIVRKGFSNYTPSPTRELDLFTAQTQS